MKGTILIADDDRDMCMLLEDGLKSTGFAVNWKTSADEAFRELNHDNYDVLLTDLKMPGGGGIELCQRVSANRPDIPVVVITAFGSMDTAVSALRAGAYDFVNKPIDIDQLALTLDRAVKHRELMEKVKVLSEAMEEAQKFDELIGTSSSMKEIYNLLERISESDASVLITGESGTGKELVARSLHKRSSRGEGPFVAINCSAVPANLLESELFGHVKGAFTDAQVSRKGLFIEADKGTLFLDEISEMPVSLQAKLLRVLEERKVRPVGGNQEIPFDARLIAATNKDLESVVDDGGFREDLFYRINVIKIEMPPLRLRGNDILILAQYFVNHYARLSGKAVQGIADAAAEKLLYYSWPGNVRELRNAVEHAVALTQFDKLGVEDLPEKIQKYHSSQIFVESNDPAELIPMAEIEKRYILHVLRATGGNRTMAANVLGLDRKTLYRKLEQYGDTEELLSNMD